ncbi:TIGR04283 family arsenosugar biosynthesis glycosyltransferase [Prochlorococcus marinus]|uniref:TIGR04283 family arsenosugar biosynthesis glycosyltransferase n=1 Tax=Prochlorococcus TaxID=1218 RepID=UPI0007BB7930|nr:TIGR04283 family arsenosugar biosynthesis glycosyltransferase [Prochlorococcus marinus]KZR76553.1 Glycosyl transferase family 2 [Prochlorococcus marinus str. MIT 1323]
MNQEKTRLRQEKRVEKEQDDLFQKGSNAAQNFSSMSNISALSEVGHHLSVIVPSLNEASRLPLLLADLQRWPTPLDLWIVDAGSCDDTELAAQLTGAQVLRVANPNRGAQLSHGACHSKGTWLMFLHADSRLPPQWPAVVEAVITEPARELNAWFFDYKIQGKGTKLRLLELAVALRSHWLQRPYGDQGLLISKRLYQRIGGYKPIPLMEDLDLVQRLSCQVKLLSLGLPLYTDGRRLQRLGLLNQAWQNAQLRRRWRRGEAAKQLSKDYYQ